MVEESNKYRDDAIAIWKAGVHEVLGDQLVLNNVEVCEDHLRIVDFDIPLEAFSKLIVVGAGKASAGMAVGLEKALSRLSPTIEKNGWINIPEGCERTTSWIHLHVARPAGKNEPTEAGVFGSRQILEMVNAADEETLVICLISGGGSALLPAPLPTIPLEDKLRLTRFLSANGANIRELNHVRTCLSEIKGGGLARNCKSGLLFSLIISDVLGDPLDIIASGPTVLTAPNPAVALNILAKFDPNRTHVPESIYQELESQQVDRVKAIVSKKASIPEVTENLIVGNNAVALDAAGVKAVELDYAYVMNSARDLEGDVEELATLLTKNMLSRWADGGPNSLLTGGEPTVTLAPDNDRGLGGRNQHLILKVVCELWNYEVEQMPNFCCLSGGTDGEDGPTDAAGAYVDRESLTRAKQMKLNPFDYLRRTDSYHFFEKLGTLLKTGPTHTNVCDLRIFVWEKRA